MIPNSNPLSFIAEMRELVKPEDHSRLLELIRQFSIVSQVRFRRQQIGDRSVGTFDDETGDRYLINCICTLPLELQNVVLQEFASAIITYNRMQAQEQARGREIHKALCRGEER